MTTPTRPPTRVDRSYGKMLPGDVLVPDAVQDRYRTVTEILSGDTDQQVRLAVKYEDGSTGTESSGRRARHAILTDPDSWVPAKAPSCSLADTDGECRHEPKPHERFRRVSGSGLTARDIELIEVALESAIMACDHRFDNKRPKQVSDLDPLAQEYVAALQKVWALRPST